MASDLVSIAAMLNELGSPTCYAEQVLLDRMRQYAASEAALSGHSAHVEWVKALVTKHCILAYREHGADPVLEREL